MLQNKVGTFGDLSRWNRITLNSLICHRGGVGSEIEIGKGCEIFQNSVLLLAKNPQEYYIPKLNCDLPCTQDQP